MQEATNDLYQTCGPSHVADGSINSAASEKWLEWDLDGAMPVTFEECERYERTLGLRLADSLWQHRPCDRLFELLDLVDSYEGPSWLWALGELWTSFSGIGLYQYELLDVLQFKVDDIGTVIPELMNREERAAFEALPDELLIYRGCGPHSVRGFSWSLKRDVAVKFPFYALYDTEVPMLLTARIPKSWVAALKLERNEHEIIVFDFPNSPRLRWTGEFLNAPPV